MSDLIALALRSLLALVLAGVVAGCCLWCRVIDPKDCVSLTWRCLDDVGDGGPDAQALDLADDDPQESTATLEFRAPHHRLECFP